MKLNNHLKNDAYKAWYHYKNNHNFKEETEYFSGNRSLYCGNEPIKSVYKI